jgi:hypothetical protein
MNNGYKKEGLIPFGASRLRGELGRTVFTQQGQPEACPPTRGYFSSVDDQTRTMRSIFYSGFNLHDGRCFCTISDQTFLAPEDPFVPLGLVGAERVGGKLPPRDDSVNMLLNADGKPVSPCVAIDIAVKQGIDRVFEAVGGSPTRTNG